MVDGWWYFVGCFSFIGRNRGLCIYFYFRFGREVLEFKLFFFSVFGLVVLLEGRFSVGLGGQEGRGLFFFWEFKGFMYCCFFLLDVVSYQDDIVFVVLLVWVYGNLDVWGIFQCCLGWGWGFLGMSILVDVSMGFQLGFQFSGGWQDEGGGCFFGSIDSVVLIVLEESVQSQLKVFCFL